LIIFPGGGFALFTSSANVTFFYGGLLLGGVGAGVSGLGVGAD